MLALLKKLSEEFNVAVVITNQVAVLYSTHVEQKWHVTLLHCICTRVARAGRNVCDDQPAERDPTVSPAPAACVHARLCCIAGDV
jgi:hypothetical protein